MIITIDMLRKAGCTDAQILQIVELVDNERTAARREQNRINKRNQRARQHVSADVADSADKEEGVSLAKKESSPRTPLKEKNSTLPPEETSPPLWPKDFREIFWGKYPHKVGKGAAIKSLERIAHRPQAPPFDEIIGALDRYRAKDDDRPWCNPATWLNQERWTDQPAIINGHGQKNLFENGTDRTPTMGSYYPPGYKPA